MLQNSWPVNLKRVKVMKIEKRLRSYSRPEETKKAWQLNPACALSCILLLDIVRTTGET